MAQHDSTDRREREVFDALGIDTSEVVMGSLTIEGTAGKPGSLMTWRCARRLDVVETSKALTALRGKAAS